MSIGRLLIVGMVVSTLFCSAAKADLSDQWVICDACTTKAEFKSAATAWFGNKTGTVVIEIASTQTNQIYQVSITGSTNPIIPASTPIHTNSATSVRENTTPGSHYTFVNYIIAESAETSLQFGKIVALVKDAPVMVGPPTNGIYGYDSFIGSEIATVAPNLYNALTAEQPGWQDGEIAGAKMEGLFNALKSLFGKGPTACQVFANGDVACYQINLLDPNAGRYIKGSAKDAQGNLINDDGWTGIGGGDAPIEVNHTSDSPYTSSYHPDGGDYWLICTLVGGKVTSCRVEYVPN